MDGSYAAVLPAGTIAANATARITWFYAAGSIANLNAVAQAVAAAAAPPVPTVVRGDQSAQVSWEAPTTADPIVNYQVQYSSNNGSSWTTFGTNFTGNVTSGNITGLSNGSTYIFRVRAITSDGTNTANGDWSGSSAPSTLATPDAPTALTGQGGDGQVTLSFTDAVSPIAPVTSYEYSIDGGTNWVTTSPALPSASVVIGGLTNGQQYSIKLRAVNSVGAGYVATVSNVVTKPTWTDSALNSTIRKASSYNDGVVAGVGVTSYSVSSGTLPAGLTLNSTSGALTGTPTTEATYSFTIRATNPGGYVESSYSLTVLPPSPAWTDQTLGTITAGDAYSDGVAASYSTAYTVISGSLPSGLTLNVATGAITGTPTVSEESYSFTIKASAPGGNVTKSFSGTVRLARPVWTSTSIGLIRAGTSFTGQLSASSAASYAITSGSLPAGVTLNTATGALTGTPTTGGPYSFTVTATNSTASVAQVVSGFVSFPIAPVTQSGGATPAVAPGSTLVQENGNFVSAVLAVVNQGIELQGTTFNLNIQAECGLISCGVQRDAGGNPFLAVDKTGTLRIEGDGFAPNSLVDVWLFSTPTFLGTVVVDPNGNFDGTFNLAQLGLPEGSHTLQASGITASGDQRVANLGIQLKGLELRYTSGAINTSMNGWFALFLIMLGLSLVFIRTFRSEIRSYRSNE